MTVNRIMYSITICLLSCFLCFTANVVSATPTNWAMSGGVQSTSYPEPAYSSSIVDLPGFGTFSAWGLADMDQGVLRSFAAGTGRAGLVNLGGGGDSGWVDTVTILSAAHDGEAARARAVIEVDGLLSVSGAGFLNAQVTVSAGSRTVFAALEYEDSVGNGGQVADWNVRTSGWNGFWYDYGPRPDFIFGTFSFDIPFTFGQAFTLETASICRGGIYADRSGAYSCNLGNSTYWGGITGITLLDGTEISGYTITSDSGVNWSESKIPSQPVPEPGTLLLLGSGLAGLGGVVWGRRD